jgi:hypothetical protein
VGTVQGPVCKSMITFSADRPSDASSFIWQPGHITLAMTMLQIAEPLLPSPVLAVQLTASLASVQPFPSNFHKPPQSPQAT